MAQKRVEGASRTVANAKASASKLQQLRSQIDKMDAQILHLINERAKVAVEIGRVKDDAGVEIFSPTREEEILSRMLGENKGPLGDRAVRAVFRELMSGSRALQRVRRVAFLGPDFSFSHIAAMEKFGHSVDYIPVGTIAGVFEIVNRGQADLGLVPIENSTDGRVADTLDMFIRLPLKICAEVSLKIHHNLLAMCSQGQIRRVYSKPQALSQCRHWLTTNLPQAQLNEVASTTTAAQLAKQEPFAAAVASRQAASNYGLNIVCADIEDRANNVTRFAVIGHHMAEQTGHDKTSLMFQLEDQPGSLADALSTVKKFNVNMTWIESFPGPSEGKSQEYLFFVDLAGHLEDPDVKRALSSLERRCKKMVILGTFPKGICYE